MELTEMDVPPGRADRGVESRRDVHQSERESSLPDRGHSAGPSLDSPRHAHTSAEPPWAHLCLYRSARGRPVPRSEPTYVGNTGTVVDIHKLCTFVI